MKNQKMGLLATLGGSLALVLAACGGAPAPTPQVVQEPTPVPKQYHIYESIPGQVLVLWLNDVNVCYYDARNAECAATINAGLNEIGERYVVQGTPHAIIVGKGNTSGLIVRVEPKK